MIEHRYDDDWFIRHRHRLLDATTFAVEERRPHAVHNILHGARLGGAVDRRIDAELRRLPPRHASAVRAHMQFYRACLTATGLVPADTLVNAAVQLEWFWYNTAFSAFYRDHLAHVMKVAALGLALLQDPSGPLTDGGALFVDVVAQGLADWSLGSPAIRAAARRAGNSPEALRDPAFWRAAVVETIRLAALLHDMAHPALIASRMSRIAAPVRPAAPFEPTERDLCRHAIASLGHRLLASPFNRGELPSAKGLAPADAEVCAEVFLHSHSLRAGYAIVRLADDADRVWQLSSFDAFVMEWAALAVSLHDYDKVWALRSSERAEDELIRRWLERDPANLAAVRPCFTSDPVSYLLAFADRMQEFGRVLGPTDRQTLDSNTMDTSVRYPCSAVTLRVERRVRDEARLTVELGADDGTCFGATDWDYERIRDYKALEGERLFGEGGWLDSRGLFASVALEVTRAAAREPESPASVARAAPVKLFYSFAEEDEALRAALERHLAVLKWKGFVADWHHRRIGAGQDWQREADAHLGAADVVLLLLSADFIASDYCRGVELEKALAMHQRGAARVIPVLVRPVYLGDTPLEALKMLPSNGKPVTEWSNQDEAWSGVVQEIQRVVKELRGARG